MEHSVAEKRLLRLHGLVVTARLKLGIAGKNFNLMICSCCREVHLATDQAGGAFDVVITLRSSI